MTRDEILAATDLQYAALYASDWDRPDHVVSRQAGRALLDRERRVLDEVLRSGATSVLDVGCGCGDFALAAAQAGLRVSIMDAVPQAVAFTKSRIERAGFAIGSLVIGLLEGFDQYPGCGFDAVVCMETLEHVRYPKACVRSLCALSFGLVVITTPVGKSYDDPMHLWHWDTEKDVCAGLGLDSLPRKWDIDRIPSAVGDRERTFLIVGRI